jgi:hypothetical protein
MKNIIVNSWTYKHLSWVIIAGLVAGIMGRDIELPQAEAITYQKTEAVVCDLACDIDKRTMVIYQANRDIYLEESRLQAIREVNGELSAMVGVSPHVDYGEISTQYLERD